MLPCERLRNAFDARLGVKRSANGVYGSFSAKMLFEREKSAHESRLGAKGAATQPGRSRKPMYALVTCCLANLSLCSTEAIHPVAFQ